MYETYQCHFELLNIGYAAYLTFFGMCKSAFPDITDQTISRMVGGLDVELYRPDDELKRLAKEAQRLGVRPRRDTAAGCSRARKTDNGAEWVADWERTADPWFVVNTDPGHPGGYHVHPTWPRRRTCRSPPCASTCAGSTGEAIDRPPTRCCASATASPASTAS